MSETSVPQFLWQKITPVRSTGRCLQTYIPLLLNGKQVSGFSPDSS